MSLFSARGRRPLLLLLVACLTVVPSARAATRGVTVEDVPLGYGGHAAGLAPGDVLLSWSRSPLPPANPRPARGRLRTEFDLLEVEVEQGPRGPVTIEGRRSGKKMRWTLPRAEWGLRARPALPASVLSLHDEARAHAGAGRLFEAADAWERAARLVAADPALAGWLLLRAASAAIDARDWPCVDELHPRAAALLEARGLDRERIAVLGSWGRSFFRRAAFSESRRRYEEALRLERARKGDSLAAARLLWLLGDVEDSDNPASERRYRESLALRERLAPESGAVAESLTLVGKLARMRDLGEAEQLGTRAVQYRERVAPESVPLAGDLSLLAGTLGFRGDFPGAWARVNRALQLLEAASSRGTYLALALGTAGDVATQTGDLDAAERYYRRALEVHRSLNPRGGLKVAYFLEALTKVALTRRDYEVAENRAREALAIRERLSPGTHPVARSLHQLGDIALDRGELERAEDLFRRALEQTLKLGGEAHAANDLRCLSLAVGRLGRLEEAQALAARSTEIRRRLSPGTLAVAQSLIAQGEIAFELGRLDEAVACYDEAIVIADRFPAVTYHVIQGHYGLARVHRRAGRREAAAQVFERVIETVDRLRRRLGGTDEARAAFSAAYAGAHQEAMEVLVELARPTDAFAVLERSRARAMLDLLGERQLLFSADLPEELAVARQRHQADYDRTQAELEAVDPVKDAAQAERLTAQLRELRDQRAQLAEKVRAASPRLATLEEAEPVGVAGVRAALEPEGVFIAYAVGPEKTLLFVLEPEGVGPPGGLTVATLPLGEPALRAAVESFRGLITRPYGDDAPLRAQAAELYDALLGPAAAAIARARRITISPDGPLHLLPFAALVPPEARIVQANVRWLAQWRGLHVVASGTHYAEILRARRERAPGAARLVAFGDPVYPQPSASASRTALSAAALGRLPSSRREVEDIAALFGSSAVTYLGGAATEARVKSGLREYDYVHFACHGLLDERQPLHSALVLSPPEKEQETENGLLQVWEIFDGVRLDADLVTLSACSTGLGREMRGEGLQGLTRAFLYSGARSVLASLWSASDEASAELMAHFYAGLRKGQTKTAALQDAQAELIRRGAPPLHWAAFAIFGDWR